MTKMILGQQIAFYFQINIINHLVMKYKCKTLKIIHRIIQFKYVFDFEGFIPEM